MPGKDESIKASAVPPCFLSHKGKTLIAAYIERHPAPLTWFPVQGAAQKGFSSERQPVPFTHGDLLYETDIQLLVFLNASF
jgi:hypothetical protein